MTTPDDSGDETAFETATCGCCGRVEPDGGTPARGGRWLGDEAPLAADLPADLRSGLGRVLGEPPMATLEAWLAAVRERAGDDEIGVDQLCHADGETPHVGRLDGEVYHFRCFYDAVVLSALVDDPVDVRTESPDGATIEATALGTDDLRVTPETAAFSVGVADGVTPPTNGDPEPNDIYGAVCPHVRAFPDRAAYERWADGVPAATAGLPLAGAAEVAAALVE